MSLHVTCCLFDGCQSSRGRALTSVTATGCVVRRRSLSRSFGYNGRRSHPGVVSALLYTTRVRFCKHWFQRLFESHARELLTGPGCDAPTDLPQQGLRYAFHLRLAL